MNHKIKVNTYAEARSILPRWPSSNIPFMLMLGTPGIGKTRLINECIPDCVLVTGRITPIGLYESCYKAAGRPIVLDDIDGLYNNESAIMLLKAMCQTEPVRKVVWATAGKYLESKGIPKEFVTSSPVCILGNEWKTKDRNVMAVTDRGLALSFEPSSAEVHKEAGKWFDDAEIYAYIGRLLHLCASPSFRTYELCRAWKAMEQDWRPLIRESWGVSEELERVVVLLSDPSYSSMGQRVDAFVAAGGSRATFFRIKRCLESAETLRPSDGGE